MAQPLHPGATFGRGVLRARHLRGWTQKELASRLTGTIAGTSFTPDWVREGVSHMERGRANPTAATMALYARALGVSIGTLWSLGESPEEPDSFPPATST